mmetsp:Transcript_6108/g.23065  ORF Transcript_6108/g.23065 Transcript_6108/m.23065 type:complete len:267 (+) Transcript_6108:688-1488(+)
MVSSSSSPILGTKWSTKVCSIAAIDRASVSAALLLSLVARPSLLSPPPVPTAVCAYKSPISLLTLRSASTRTACFCAALFCFPTSSSARHTLGNPRLSLLKDFENWFFIKVTTFVSLVTSLIFNSAATWVFAVKETRKSLTSCCDNLNPPKAEAKAFTVFAHCLPTDSLIPSHKSCEPSSSAASTAAATARSACFSKTETHPEMRSRRAVVMTRFKSLVKASAIKEIWAVIASSSSSSSSVSLSKVFGHASATVSDHALVESASKP